METGKTYYIFDRTLFRPVKVKCLEVNDLGEWRFEYVEVQSSYFKYFSCPPETCKELVFESKSQCIHHQVHKLLDLMDQCKPEPVYQSHPLTITAEELQETINVIKQLIDNCPCKCGGFDEQGVCPQPCDECDKGRETIAKLEEKCSS